MKASVRLQCSSIIGLLLILAVLSQFLAHSSAQLSGFVTRQGSQLMLNDDLFRFGGMNIYWLALDENVGGVDYPTEFRVDDVLATAKEMGATVVRSHAAISTGCSLCIEPSLDMFNETALRKLDYAIKSAGDNGIRLVLPLTDNYHYYQGGKHDFTDWRGVMESEFYTNIAVIDDFKQYIRAIINRINTYTGIAYKDDPAILAWETGNELDAPTSWTQTIADYIKSIDSNHLVADGNSGIDIKALTLTNVDIYSRHFYPMSVSELNYSANIVKKANKVFIAGEYDWNNVRDGDPLGDFLVAIESNSVVAGDMLWCLFGHNDNYGYVMSNAGYKLHYPGDTDDMRSKAQVLRNHAYAMRGERIPADSIPGAPLITNVTGAIAWRGVAGAYKYTIARSTSGVDGPWTVICDQCATDNDTPWVRAIAP